MDFLRFIGINRDTTTAGPGKRLEFFTKGCIRGVIAPCFGCFNESTWTFEGPFRKLSVDEVVNICAETAWNRQVTFCGGEPILQARAITQVAKRLKEIDPTFHFVMYTAYKIDSLLKHGLSFTWVKEKHEEAMYQHLMDYSHSSEKRYNENGDLSAFQFRILYPEDVRELMAYIDLIVDGDYQHDKRLTTHEYMHEGWFVGSANQRVIYGPASIRVNKLIYLPADEYNRQMQKANHCKCCGMPIIDTVDYCSVVCRKRHEEHKKEFALMKSF